MTPVGCEALDGGVVQREAFSQHLQRVLRQQRRRPLRRERRPRHPDRHVHERNAAGERMRQVEFHAARQQLRIREHGVELVDRTARHADCFQRGEPLALRTRGDGAGDQRHERVTIPDALHISCEAFVACPFRMAGDRAELRELAVVADGENEVAVGAREHLIRDDVLVRVSGAARRRAGHQVVHCHHRHHRHGGIEKSEVDVLARARALTMLERRQDSHRRIHAGHQVGDRHARLLRAAARQVVAFPGDAHESAHALDDEIVPGAIGVRPVLSKSGDRRVDQARIERGHAGVVETVLGEAADLEVLHQHIGLQREIADDLLSFRFREIDGDGQFAAIARQVVRRLRRVAAGRVLQEGRSPRARVVAASRALDLDDGRAQVRKQLRAPWTCEHARQVEDRQVGERTGHGSHEKGAPQRHALPILRNGIEGDSIEPCKARASRY